MPFRETDYVERCIACGADTALRCARCGGPGCAAHLFTDDDLCEECETEFLRRMSTEEGRRWSPLPIGIGVVLSVPLILAGMLVAGSAIYAAGFVASFVGPLLVRNRTRRLAYIRELRSAAPWQLPSPRQLPQLAANPTSDD